MPEPTIGATKLVLVIGLIITSVGVVGALLVLDILERHHLWPRHGRGGSAGGDLELSLEMAASEHDGTRPPSSFPTL